MSVGCKNPCDDIERLKVCGTCAHRNWGYRNSMCWAGSPTQYGVDDHDFCHFTPSRWQPYWIGESDG